jgi:phosphopantetheinyl transferase (holo-ACP synthase)
MERKMTFIEKIVNIQTNEIIERPYTETEMAIVEAKRIELAKVAASEAEAAAAKSALLDRLGITEEEAKLLLS